MRSPRRAGVYRHDWDMYSLEQCSEAAMHVHIQETSSGPSSKKCLCLPFLMIRGMYRHSLLPRLLYDPSGCLCLVRGVSKSWARVCVCVCVCVCAHTQVYDAAYALYISNPDCPKTIYEIPGECVCVCVCVLRRCFTCALTFVCLWTCYVLHVVHAWCRAKDVTW